MFDYLSKGIHLENNRKITAVLVVLVAYGIFCRIVPLSVLAVLFVLTFAAALGYLFYDFVLFNYKVENNNQSATAYSWGYVRETTKYLDLNTFVAYVRKKDFNFLKEFANSNKQIFILYTFVFADFIIAFKNLDLFNSGAYFAMALVSKFVFLGYLYMKKNFDAVALDVKERLEAILDIFYTHINGLLSVFTVIFILVFILSKYIIEILFGEKYQAVQSSFPFILLGSMFLCVALCVYEAAKIMDVKLTNSILKIYLTIFGVLFVFLPIGYIDTVTYFVVGSSALFSISLYNLVIKKPDYIARTYNHLF